MNKTVQYTNISEINIDLDIDINFFNSHIFTTNKLEKFNIQSEIKYLCISTDVLLEDCIVVGDINVKPRLILILNILTYLTKNLFDHKDYKKSFTSNGSVNEVEHPKFYFNGTNFNYEFDNIIRLLESNKESKKQLFHKKMERYYKSFFMDSNINEDIGSIE